MKRALFLVLFLAGCKHTLPAHLDDPAAPAPGLYHCWAGGFAHLPAGTLTLLAGGRYESYRRGGGGRYSFTPADAGIEFLDGDYHAWEYRGVVERAPFAAAAVQAPKAAERIVLLPLGAAEPIGHERPGEYQYCYR